MGSVWVVGCHLHISRCLVALSQSTRVSASRFCSFTAARLATTEGRQRSKKKKKNVFLVICLAGYLARRTSRGPRGGSALFRRATSFNYPSDERAAVVCTKCNAPFPPLRYIHTGDDEQWPPTKGAAQVLQICVGFPPKHRCNAPTACKVYLAHLSRPTRPMKTTPECSKNVPGIFRSRKTGSDERAKKCQTSRTAYCTHLAASSAQHPHT